MGDIAIRAQIVDDTVLQRSMNAWNGLLVEVFEDVVCAHAPEPDEGGNACGNEEGRQEEDEGNPNPKENEEDDTQDGEDKSDYDGEYRD